MTKWSKPQSVRTYSPEWAYDDSAIAYDSNVYSYDSNVPISFDDWDTISNNPANWGKPAKNKTPWS